MSSDASYDARSKATEGTRLKILTPKQMLQSSCTNKSR